MTLFRPLKEDDIEKVTKIHKHFHDTSFSFPTATNLLSTGIIENDDKQVIAFGALKALGEMIMVLDLDEPKRTKIDALVKLIRVGILDAKQVGLEQVHCFVENPEFSSLLKKHFNFTVAPGEALVLNL